MNETEKYQKIPEQIDYWVTLIKERHGEDFDIEQAIVNYRTGYLTHSKQTNVMLQSIMNLRRAKYLFDHYEGYWSGRVTYDELVATTTTNPFHFRPPQTESAQRQYLHMHLERVANAQAEFNKMFGHGW